MQSKCMLRAVNAAAHVQRTGGSLQLLQHRVLLDAGRDDDGGGHAKTLVREVDLLDGLGARERRNPSDRTEF